ncbi:hypothetical protein GCM10009801_67910 [Streptomyces albiaxialis]|uniref:Integral membrane protein n=1 Tax=Streptomyces albiaxialis TaxID=329523 RepID=A0ABN2WRM6_9ACTN
MTGPHGGDGAPPWAMAVEAAEAAVRGDGQALALLSDPDDPVLADVLGHPALLDTPEGAGRFAYLVALLRESGRTRSHARALDEAEERVMTGGVPRDVRGAVHTRVAVLLAEAGRNGAARAALRFGLPHARDGRERARIHALFGVLAARQQRWAAAATHARTAARHLSAVPDPRERLEIRMRSVSVLFQAAGAEGEEGAARELAVELESVCGRLIDAWGDEHPRALAALVTMASARHEIAVRDGDAWSAERLAHVLAVAAQRASVTLGARHPQTHAVREALARTEEWAPVRADVRADVRAEAEPEPEPEREAEPGPEPEPSPEPLRVLSLELIVHGVVDTDPAEMLGDTRIEQTQGDTTAGLFRRTEDVDAEERGDEGPRSVSEAYTWSNAVTGSRSRTLWLILLPFTLINLAHWTRPAARGFRRTVRLHGVLVRLLALSLTALTVAAVCAVAMDVVAWQCAGTPACAKDRSWLAFLAAGPDGAGGWWSRPGTRLTVAALVPAGLLLLVWWLAQRTWQAYENKPPPTFMDRDPDEDDVPLPLARPGFWYTARLIARLRAAHTALGVAVIAEFLVAAPRRYDREAPDTGVWLETLGRLVLVPATLCVTMALYVVARRGHSAALLDTRIDRAVVRALSLLALLTLLLAATYTLWPRPGWESSGRLPGGEAFGMLALVQGVCVLALAVVGAVLHRRGAAPRAALRGLAPAAAAMLACGLAMTLAAGAAQGITDWLFGRGAFGGKGLPLPGPAPQLVSPVAIVPVLLVVVLLVQCAVIVILRQRARRLKAEVPTLYPESAPDPARSRLITRAMVRASLLDTVPWLLATVLATFFLLMCAAVVGAQLTQDSPGDLDAPFTTARTLGSWLIALGFVLFLNRGRIAYRDPASVSTLGILWDVGTFWPRAAHPFAPPCYAERAVPDLTWRMATWARRMGPQGRLLVSGHSQGSVLAVAALFQLDGETRSRVSLLTYGSPLERIYARWFPAFLGPDALATVHRRVENWRNLWRFTDPVGGPMGVPGAEIDRPPLRDPLAYGRTLEHPLPRPILGHGDYRSDPGFAEERARLLTPPAPEPDVPAVPPRRSRAGPG